MKALIVARLTLQEALRRRMIWVVLGLSLLFLGVYFWGFTQVRDEFMQRAARSGGRGQILNLDSVATVMVGLGFYTVNFLAGVMTIFAAVGTVAGEIESGTFQAIIPKPIARWQIILGKFLGFAAMICAYIILMAGGVIFAARFIANYTPGNIIPGTLLVILVSLVLLSLTILGSTIFQTMANGVVVFMLYGGAMLGGLLELIGSLANINSLINSGIIISLILPSDAIWRLASTLLQPNSQLRLDTPIPIAVTRAPSNAMVIYAVGYAVVLLTLAILAFRRRDL